MTARRKREGLQMAREFEARVKRDQSQPQPDPRDERIEALEAKCALIAASNKRADAIVFELEAALRIARDALDYCEENMGGPTAIVVDAIARIDRALGGPPK